MTTILLATTEAPLSKIVRAFTRAPFSHCGIGLTIEGQRMVVDASLLGVEMVARARWFAKRRVLHEFAVGERDAFDVSWLMGELGAGYDYSGMFGYMPVFVARWFGRKIRNPWASPTLSVCSELVVRAMRAHPIWGGLDPETSDPSVIERVCRGLNYQDILAPT